MTSKNYDDNKIRFLLIFIAISILFAFYISDNLDLDILYFVNTNALEEDGEKKSIYISHTFDNSEYSEDNDVALQNDNINKNKNKNNQIEQEISNGYNFYDQTKTKKVEQGSNVFKIIAISDVGCSLRAQENIRNIENLQPDLFFVAGDIANQKNPDCWFHITKSLDKNIKIAIGNHEDKEEPQDGSEELIQTYLNHYDLPNSYYSFDHKNLHVLVMDTQKEFSTDRIEKNSKKLDKNYAKLIKEIEETGIVKDSIVEDVIDDLDIEVDPEQYEFVVNDLEKAANDPSIDWIFVMFHKPMYTSPSTKQPVEFIIRDKYQPIFDEYNVDLVIQGHNHIYSRTLPLSFNQSDITQPVVDENSINNNNSKDIFTNPNGTIFLVVGLGGDKIHRIATEIEPYNIANRYNKGFGFLDLNIDEKRLDGTFYDINLNCEVLVTEKKDKEKIDHLSCVPPLPSPTTSIRDNNNLKVIDHFTIIK